MANWVSDELHSILGLSDKYVSQFLVGLANKSKSPEDLVRRIRETETVEVNDAVVAFANKLYHKIPRQAAVSTSGGSGKNAPSAAVLKQWELQKKNETYQMLDDTDDDDDEDEKPKKKKLKKEKKEKKREKREKGNVVFLNRPRN